jgi:predicted ATPase/class 3 adenylate cyclase
LVRDSLSDGVTLLDLGEHRLKDLQRPERLFQAAHPSLAAEFPPVRTLENRPNNLPVQSTLFIGRETELQLVRQRLLRDDIRLLTLTGPGGTGKTRLALQVAAEVLDEFSDGVYFVPLASIADVTLVAAAIVQALELREAAGRSPVEILKDHLQEKRLLLVLDNFEQVIEAAPVLADLLKASSALNLLVTSREALHLSAEHEYPVPPLALPDPKRLPNREALTQYAAVALFIQRAMAVKPDFKVTNANAPAIAEICARLDGLPLAIELAAARVKLLPPEALLSRLDRRLKVLTGGARDVPARQQTLRGAIEWSYNLLEPAEQELFARLSVFSNGCTVEAAEAVCDAEGDLDVEVLDGLSSLVDKSLIRQEEPATGGSAGEPRFRMLETIREYGLERLAAGGNAPTLQRRHAGFFSALARQAEPELRGPEQAAWLDRLEAEHDNGRTALDWLATHGEEDQALCLAGALWRFWWVRGYLNEGYSRLKALLALPGAAARTGARAEALFGAGVLALLLQDLTASRAAFEESRAIWEELGDESGVAYSTQNLGEIDTELGNYAAACAHLEQSVQLFHRLGERPGLAWSSAAYALAVHLRGEAGDSPTGRRAAEVSTDIFTDLGDQVGLAHALGILATIVDDEGEYDGACSHYRKALALMRAVDNRTGLAVLLEGIAAVAAVRGKPQRAARLASAAQQVYKSYGGWQFSSVHAKLKRRLDSVRHLLGEDNFDAAWEQGSQMTQEQAIDDALAVTAAERAA